MTNFFPSFFPSRPQEAKIQPLTGVRDRWPGGKIIYEIVLTYAVKIVSRNFFSIFF